MNARTKIDWESQRLKLQARQEALERTEASNADRLAQVFRQRAIQFATRGQESQVRNNESPFLIFRLGADRYCLPLSALVEVVPFARCTRVPGAPREMLGVFNVRGEIRTVLDLARLLRLPNEAERVGGYVLLVRHANHEIGIWIEKIVKIENIAPDTLIAMKEDEESNAASQRFRTTCGAIVLVIEEVLTLVIHQREGRVQT